MNLLRFEQPQRVWLSGDDTQLNPNHVCRSALDQLQRALYVASHKLRELKHY